MEHSAYRLRPNPRVRFVNFLFVLMVLLSLLMIFALTFGLVHPAGA